MQQWIGICAEVNREGGWYTGESRGSTQNAKTQEICLIYDSEGEPQLLKLNTFYSSI